MTGMSATALNPKGSSLLLLGASHFHFNYSFLHLTVTLCISPVTVELKMSHFLSAEQMIRRVRGGPGRLKQEIMTIIEERFLSGCDAG